MRVAIRYPMTAGRLVLRTEPDWDTDLEPIEATPEGARFELRFTTPTLALKPCLVTPDGLVWGQGPNYVLSANEPDPTIYPFFSSMPKGRVSERLRVESEDGVHMVRVYHPPGYAENTLRRFPVVYMHDGQNLFFPEEAFAGDEWQVDETMDRLDEMNAIRKTIVVGISPADRMREYTRPGYGAYGRFMAGRLKPLMDQQLRTRPGPESTVVMGSSLGGVAALHLAWEHTAQFGKVACLSTTFGYQDDLYERIAAGPRRSLHIYLDSGWPRDNYEITNAMRDLLVAQGWKLGTDLLHFSFPDALHNERAWALRAHIPFQFLLGRAWAASRGEG